MTRIHADPTLPARVEAAALPWDPSPMPGVERRRIERDGDEVARVTSLVRYAPGSRFSPHTHSGGEEFYVLEGTFCDEHGAYGAGTYVRNPVGSAHAPFTEEGCVILVKLWWMHPEDDQRAVEDTTEGWQPAHYGSRRPLFESPRERVALAAIAPGRSWTRPYEGGLELFVISGQIAVDGVEQPALTWLRCPGRGALQLSSGAGGVAWIKENPGEFVSRIPMRLAQLMNPHSFLTRHLRWTKWKEIQGPFRESLYYLVVLWSFIGALGGTN